MMIASGGLQADRNKAVASMRIVDAEFMCLVSLTVMCMQGLDNRQSWTIHDSIENGLAITPSLSQTFLSEFGQML